MSTDYNLRAAKGQAYNLAVADAIQAGKAHDVKYVYERYTFYYTIGQLIQDSDLDMIQEVADNKDLDKAIEAVKKALEK